MGGTISITLREEDGTEHRMLRWTNILPAYLHDPALFDRKKEWVDDFLQQHKEMEDDYKRNHKTGKYENAMTSVYFPGVGLAPYGYGLVVIDMMSCSILSLQGYTAPGKLSVMAFSNDSTETLSKLMKAKRVIEAWHLAQDVGLFKLPDDPTEASINAALGGEIISVTVDTSPFQILGYRENKKGLHVFKDMLRVLDFKFTKEELAQWKKFGRRYKN